MCFDNFCIFSPHFLCFAAINQCIFHFWFPFRFPFNTFVVYFNINLNLNHKHYVGNASCSHAISCENGWAFFINFKVTPYNFCVFKHLNKNCSTNMCRFQQEEFIWGHCDWSGSMIQFTNVLYPVFWGYILGFADRMRNTHPFFHMELCDYQLKSNSIKF